MERKQINEIVKLDMLDLLTCMRSLLQRLPNLVKASGYKHEYVYKKMGISKSKYFRFLNGEIEDINLLMDFYNVFDDESFNS